MILTWVVWTAGHQGFGEFLKGKSVSFLPLVIFSGGISALIGHFGQIPFLFWTGFVICSFSFVMDRLAGGPFPFIELAAVGIAKFSGLGWIPAIGVGLAIGHALGYGFASLGIFARRGA